jgi:CRP-like cAMP-binding protein
MKIQSFLAHLHHIHPVSEDFARALDSSVTFVTFPRNHFLIEMPRVADHLFFMMEGFAHSYVYHREEKHVENFWHAGQFIYDARSFFEGLPSREFVQVSAAAQLLCLSRAHAQELLAQFPESQVLARLLLCHQEDGLRQRVRMFRRCNLEERFRALLLEHPFIEQHVSQDVIASYLGVAPQSLARLKRRHR